jgi:DNA-directed RNA polymerase specialized sigma subunit
MCQDSKTGWERLGFNSEVEFITSFQRAYGKHRNGHPTNSDEREIIDAFCQAYSPRIEKWASTWSDREGTWEAIWVAIVNRIDRFKPTESSSFSRWLRQQALWAGCEHSRSRPKTGIPRYQKERANAYNQVVDQLREECGCTPADEDIARRLAWPIERVRETQRVIGFANPESLDDLVDETRPTGTPTIDFIVAGSAAPDEILEHRSTLEALPRILNCCYNKLRPLHRAVIAFRKFDQKSREDTANLMHIQIPYADKLYSEAMKAWWECYSRKRAQS